MTLSNKIQIISASAGSGKTYRLSNLLEEEVKSGRVRPDAVLATTFTKKAAAELQERVKTRLLNVGLSVEAQQLSAARIGTVNSVCGGFLADFAFVLGISPQQTVLEEDAVGKAISRAMSRILDKDVTREIWRIEQIFPGTDVRDAVTDIISKARSNGISPDQLEEFAKRSCNEFIRLLGAASADGEQLTEDLYLAVEQFLEDVDPLVDTTKDTEKVLAKVKRIKNRINYGRQLPWLDWLSLSKLKTGAKSRDAAQALATAASKHDEHPQLRSQVCQLIELVFSLAAQTMDAYQAYKSEWGVVDFVDQEALFLQLLYEEEPAAVIGEQLDLVLVDEFQDTSPIQLAIFMRLAELAQKSVWVGDQKQSIYGFRDADPSLMDVAVDGILREEEPETLKYSWRSRSELVRSTSDIFVNAFSGQGFPESQVRLEPAQKVIDEEPSGLGAIYEYWQLQSKNNSNDVLALANGVSTFLADDTSIVRDRESGIGRRGRGGDIAILCRANDVCVDVARALEDHGVAAAISRPGLMDQPEIVMCLAGVRLLLNPYDSLARAEIARLLDNPGDHDVFLQKALKEQFAAGWKLEVFDRIEEARSKLQTGGPIEFLDTSLELLALHKLCHAWGDGESRLANLDSLRCSCVQYVAECENNLRGATASGMLAWLDEKEDAHQAEVRGADSVQVLTWHKAKGLEWPVVVLFQLNKVYPALPLGVNSASEGGFSLSDPLFGRWLRYWPDPYLDTSNPYAVVSSGAPFHDRLNLDEVSVEHRSKAVRQELRLLYVGWTRARDRVILAGRKSALQKGIMRLLVDEEGNHLLEEPGKKQTVWAGRQVDVGFREVLPTLGASGDPKQGITYDVPGHKEYPPVFLAASSISGEWDVLEQEILGERLGLVGKPNMQRVGECVHGFLAADNVIAETAARQRMADGLLTRWGVADNLTVQDMFAASERLSTWIDSRWPGAIQHKEFPVQVQQESGTIVSGFIDLLVEVENGYIIIDHKSFPGNREQAVQKAVAFGGQLQIYKEGVEKASGKAVLGCFIHLPVVGMCCEVIESWKGRN